MGMTNGCSVRLTGLLAALAVVAAGCGASDVPERSPVEPGTFPTPQRSAPAPLPSRSVAPTEAPSAAPSPAASPEPEPEPAHLVAAGDLAWCGAWEDDTAALAATLPGTIAALGDLAYDRGSERDFERCWAPTWGVDELRERTRASVGNHDVVTDRARPMFEQFGGMLAEDVAAQDPQRAGGVWPDGWYSYELGDWHVIVLNSNCAAASGCGADSRQVAWLRDDLARHGGGNVLAYWHHPRFSSLSHGPDRSVQPFWDALLEAGVDLVLAGHEHGYERRLVGDEPLRQFIVGTGGAVLRRMPATDDPDVEARINDAYGVLHLELGTCGYAWRFLEVPDEPGGAPTVRDEGRADGTC